METLFEHNAQGYSPERTRSKESQQHRVTGRIFGFVSLPCLALPRPQKEHLKSRERDIEKPIKVEIILKQIIGQQNGKGNALRIFVTQ